MQPLKAKQTIWSLLKPFYWLCRIAGLAAFSIDGDMANGRIKVRRWDIVYMFFSCLLHFNSIYIKTTVDMSLSRTDSFLIDKGAHLIGIFNSYNVFVGAAIYLFNQKKIWKIFREIYVVDNEFLKLGYDVNKNMKTPLIILCSALTAIYVFMYGLTFYLLNMLESANSKFAFALGLMSANYFTTIFLVSFSLILYAIYRRFECINDCIRDKFKTDDEEPLKVFEKNSLRPERLIIKLADLHDSLNDIVVIVNQCFSFLIMMCFASAFLFNIFSIFGSYKIFVRQNYKFIVEAIIQSSWNAYFYVYCFMAIVVSSMVTRSGKFSAVLCHKAINYSDDESIIDHFKLFSQQMRHRSPVVSCGLFTFDFTLLFTILGATATYIVILIQFDSAPIEFQTPVISNTSLSN